MEFDIHINGTLSLTLVTDVTDDDLLFSYNVPGLMNKQIWIGLAEVRPLPGCKLLEEAKGAYVHVMAWAESPEELRKKASLRAADVFLEIVQLNETEPWSIRTAAQELHPEFFEMESRIEYDVRGVAFGRFHAWLKDSTESKNHALLSR